MGTTPEPDEVTQRVIDVLLSNLRATIDALKLLGVEVTYRIEKD